MRSICLAVALPSFIFLAACGCPTSHSLAGRIFAATSYSDSTEPIFDITSGTPANFATVNAGGWVGPLVESPSGHLFAATDANGGSLYDITAGGDQTAAKPLAANVFGSALSYIEGLAFDAQGNAYLSNTEASTPQALAKVTPQGQISQLTPQFQGPGALLFLNGALLVSETQTGKVERLDLTSGAVTDFATGFVGGSGHVSAQLAQDSGSHIYVLWTAGTSTGIFDITAGGDFSNKSPAVAAGFTIDVNQLAINAAGDLFAAGASDGTTLVARRSGSGFNAFSTFASGLGDSESLAIPH